MACQSSSHKPDMIEVPVQDMLEVEEGEPEVEEEDKHELEEGFHCSKKLQSSVTLGSKSYSCCKVKYHTLLP